jgi:hypothetical protein
VNCLSKLSRAGFEPFWRDYRGNTMSPTQLKTDAKKPETISDTIGASSFSPYLGLPVPKQPPLTKPAMPVGFFFSS